MTPAFTLQRTEQGRLACTLADGTRHASVTPVRAFPLSAPDDGLSLVGIDGREVLWIERLDQVPEPVRRHIMEELAMREFAPVLARVLAVSTFSTPSTWTVQTDRGATQLVLKAEEDIRRLQGDALLLTDANGLCYRVKDLAALDRHSRKLIDRFL